MWYKNYTKSAECSLSKVLLQGDSVFDAAQTHSARKNYVHKRIKYLSHIIFVHSANRTFSIIIHRRVVRVGIQFCDQFLYSKITLQISRFQFDSSFLYIHLMLKFHTQNRDFNWSTRIVNFIHNLVHKFEISLGRREWSNLHHFNEFLHTGCSLLQYQNIRVSNTHVCIHAHRENPRSMRCLYFSIPKYILNRNLNKVKTIRLHSQQTDILHR